MGGEEHCVGEDITTFQFLLVVYYFGFSSEKKNETNNIFLTLCRTDIDPYKCVYIGIGHCALDGMWESNRK